MELYEGDMDHTVPEIRYDLSGYGGYPCTDQVGLEMRYTTDYDWSGVNVDPNRQMYPIGETVDPQCQAYLGYPEMSQQQQQQQQHHHQQQQQQQQHVHHHQQELMSVGGVSYLPMVSDVSCVSPLRHIGFGCGDTLYSPTQTFNSSVSPSGSSSSVGSNGSTSGGAPGQKPKRKRVQSAPQRKAANIRERRRMFHLNEAFDELRKRLPAFNYEKRLSRIETLRLAMTYIGFMKNVSEGQDPKDVKLLTMKATSDDEEDSVSSQKENIIVGNEI